MGESKLETHLCVRLRRKGDEVALPTQLIPSHSSASLGSASGVRVGGGGSAGKETSLGTPLYLQEALQRAKPSFLSPSTAASASPGR